MPSSTVLYTDLSGYYDLMCADINYAEQSNYVRRIHQLLGNQGKRHLDLACGTGPHVRHFLDFNYNTSGLDINQPMLTLAQTRCPKAHFTLQDMCSFSVDEPQDLITCFLYSIHYNGDISKLKDCIASTYTALQPGGMFCFNAVDKNTIDNRDGIKHSVVQDDCLLNFQSGWHYAGSGDRQTLLLTIEKIHDDKIETWQDQHPMVAVSFAQLIELLSPFFTVDVFEHNFEKIVPWNKVSGNAIFVCIKK